MSFIETEFLKDNKICDKLIAYFIQCDKKHAAMHIVNGETVIAEPKIKTSTDITISVSSV